MANQNIDIREGMSVFDENKGLLGKVERLSGNSFYLNGQQYPVSSITRYDQKGLYLSGMGQQEAVLPVVEEQMAVGKREVERGGARITTHVTEQPVEAQVNLRDEQIKIDRQAVNRPLTAADQAILQNGAAIEVTETDEEPVVAKQARVVEEVRVGKQVSERTETVRDSVKRTDVEVEQLDGQTENRPMTDRNR